MTDVTQTLCDALGWRWHINTHQPVQVHELLDARAHVLAWLQRRPGYCDRGHWAAGVECVPSIDEADAFPRYFMRLETGKRELVEFLAWRLHKIAAETPPTGPSED